MGNTTPTPKFRGRLAHLAPALLADMTVLVREHATAYKPLEPVSMYSLLYEVAAQRAYDDSHPRWAAGIKRVLPYDGRHYCWYYEGGADDTHVSTMLGQIEPHIRKLLEEIARERGD